MSRSIAAHDCSSSVLFLAVRKIVLKRFNAILVWSCSPMAMLGCLAFGTVMGNLFFIFLLKVLTSLLLQIFRPNIK